MKRVYLRAGKYSIGILAVSFIIAFTVRAQQPDSSAPRPEGERVSGKADPDPDPFKTYVFPTKQERFDRYVSDTVGPLRLARTAFSAGVHQWRDTPEDWGQGMKGYGKRFASSFGRNAIQQSVTR